MKTLHKLSEWNGVNVTAVNHPKFFLDIKLADPDIAVVAAELANIAAAAGTKPHWVSEPPQSPDSDSNATVFTRNPVPNSGHCHIGVPHPYNITDADDRRSGETDNDNYNNRDREADSNDINDRDAADGGDGEGSVHSSNSNIN